MQFLNKVVDAVVYDSCPWSRQCSAVAFTDKVVDIPVLALRTVELPQIQSSTKLNDKLEGVWPIFSDSPRGVESWGARIFPALDDEEFFVVEGSLGWRGSPGV